MIEIRTVSVKRLRTSLAPLRGPGTARKETLSALPLRVIEVEDGDFEIFDGFKRYARCLSDGAQVVPVIVEDADLVTAKARLLAANTPKHTATAMDEARVVASLVEEDGRTVDAVGKVLGKQTRWAERRLMLAKKLAPALATRLDRRSCRSRSRWISAASVPRSSFGWPIAARATSSRLESVSPSWRPIAPSRTPRGERCSCETPGARCPRRSTRARAHSGR